MTAGSVILLAFLFALGYLITPILMVWGWVRWIKERPRLWTIASTLSFVGFLLATASALYGLWTISYGAAGGFITSHGYSPDYGLFYRFVRRGAILSMLGFAFAICGVWRRSAVRWQAPATAVGTFACWLLASTLD
jgi:hypothetical protein